MDSTTPPYVHRTLEIWGVYKHPLDFPDKYVARRFDLVGADAVPTEEVFWCDNREPIDIHFMSKGFTWFPRDVGDDLPILGTYMR